MYPVEHIWTILMLKILQAHLLPAFVVNSKIDAIYALYLESFCDKILLSGKFSLFLTLAAPSVVFLTNSNSQTICCQVDCSRNSLYNRQMLRYCYLFRICTIYTTSNCPVLLEQTFPSNNRLKYEPH